MLDLKSWSMLLDMHLIISCLLYTSIESYLLSPFGSKIGIRPLWPWYLWSRAPCRWAGSFEWGLSKKSLKNSTRDQVSCSSWTGANRDCWPNSSFAWGPNSAFLKMSIPNIPQDAREHILKLPSLQRLTLVADIQELK